MEPWLEDFKSEKQVTDNFFTLEIQMLDIQYPKLDLTLPNTISDTVWKSDTVVYICFICVNWSSNDVLTWRHFTCSLHCFVGKLSKKKQSLTTQPPFSKLHAKWWQVGASLLCPKIKQLYTTDRLVYLKWEGWLNFCKFSRQAVGHHTTLTQKYSGDLNTGYP